MKAHTRTLLRCLAGIFFAVMLFIGGLSFWATFFTASSF